MIFNKSLTEEGDNSEESKNPLVVVLGDSVTAGQFEMKISLEEWAKSFESKEKIYPFVVDLRHVYHEVLRMMLHDK